MYMVQNPNPEAVIQVEKITGSVLSNLECFSEKVLENKKYKQKSVENLRFSTLYHLAGVQGLEPWARGFGDRCSTN